MPPAPLPFSIVICDEELRYIFEGGIQKPPAMTGNLQ